MKRHMALILLLCSLAVPGLSAAQQAWLLLHTAEDAAIYRAEKGGMHQVTRVGHSVIYGETERSLAVISQRTPADQILLQIIDKRNETTTSTWSLQGFPVQQLSGPSRDVALTDKFAYYVAVRFGKDGRTLEANELGAHFDFYRISLANGRLDRFPLPPECANPRVITFNGVPLVYSWNGYGMWRFDTKRSELTALLLRRDIDDTIVSDDADALASTKAGSFADYVAVPSVGLFRISRLGGLKQVLDAGLTRMTVSRAMLNLGQRGDVIRAFPGTADGRPVIGVLIAREDERRFAAIDSLSMRVIREFVLPKEAVLDSVAISRDGAVAYLDRETIALRRVVRGDDIETLWTVTGRVPPEYMEYARIISLDP